MFRRVFENDLDLYTDKPPKCPNPGEDLEVDPEILRQVQEFTRAVRDKAVSSQDVANAWVSFEATEKTRDIQDARELATISNLNFSEALEIVRSGQEYRIREDGTVLIIIDAEW